MIDWDDGCFVEWSWLGAWWIIRYDVQSNISPTLLCKIWIMANKFLLIHATFITPASHSNSIKQSYISPYLIPRYITIPIQENKTRKRTINKENLTALTFNPTTTTLNYHCLYPITTTHLYRFSFSPRISPSLSLIWFDNRERLQKENKEDRKEDVKRWTRKIQGRKRPRRKLDLELNIKR